MKSFAQFFKKLLFRVFSFQSYLSIVSKGYFILYNLGALKNNYIYKYHYYLKKLINEGDVVIDLGANLGYYSVPFSKWVGPDGMVYAVEPLAPVREILQKNIRDRQNIEVIPFALGDKSKKIRMGNNTRRRNGVIGTGSHFVLDNESHAFDEFEAEMRKGSEVFNHLNRLDFIKCDVEGYETIIIPELEELIVKFEPLMLIETWSEKRKFLLEYLDKIGYSGFVLHDNKLYPADQIENTIKGDVLFIPVNKTQLLKDDIHDLEFEK